MTVLLAQDAEVRPTSVRIVDFPAANGPGDGAHVSLLVSVSCMSSAGH